MKLGFSFQDLLKFDFEEGMISFRGNRMLLFNADALGQLRDELIKTLGEDIARGVLTRFGYRCGYADVLSVGNMFDLETDADWMLAGPLIHTLEGLVHVTNEHLEFDRQQGTFLMRGIWRNSYEAAQHVRLYGQATGPVCWTLSGYASGFASGFMGRDIICVETMCEAKGDPHCVWELRNKESWGQEAAGYIQDLQPNTVVKSLQKLLAEEKDRVLQWRALNEAAVEITTNYDSTKLPKKFIQYARQMLFAQEACMALVVEEGQFLVYRTDAGGVRTEKTGAPGGLLTKVLSTGRPIVVERDFLGVPLYYKGTLVGAMVVVKKIGSRSFTQDDEELLQILGAQAAIAIENARLYERTDEQLREKVLQLHQLNHVLSAQHSVLQKTTDLHKRLTALVLEGKGLQAIAQTLAQIITCPVWVEDHRYRLIARSEPNGEEEADRVFRSMGDLKTDAKFAKQIPILLDGKRLIALETGDDGTHQQIIVPIVAGQEVLGYLSAIQKDKKLVELDYIAMEQAGTVFALELLKQKAASEVEMRLTEDFIEELLAGHLEAGESTDRRAEQLGFNLRAIYRVFMVEVEGLNDVQRMVAKRKVYDLVKEVAQRHSSQSIVVNRNRSILVFVETSPHNVSDLVVQALEMELNKQFGQTVWRLAIGGCFSRLEQCQESYRQAQTTLEIMKSLNQYNRVMAYERLGVFAMLEVNKDRFGEFAHRVIGPLIEYDQKHNGELMSTLDLYFRNNGNTLKAARNGFLNHSTMKYRLRRIEEIACIDLDDPDISLQVQLALKLIM